MKMIVKLLTSTAFLMGLAVVVSLLTNQFVTGVYPDFLAKDSGLRSNITIFLLACMLTVTMSRIPYNDLNPVKNAKSVARAIFLGLVVASSIPLIAYFLLKDSPEYGKYAVGLVFLAATAAAGYEGFLASQLIADFLSAASAIVLFKRAFSQ